MEDKTLTPNHYLVLFSIMESGYSQKRTKIGWGSVKFPIVDKSQPSNLSASRSGGCTLHKTKIGPGLLLIFTTFRVSSKAFLYFKTHRIGCYLSHFSLVWEGCKIQAEKWTNVSFLTRNFYYPENFRLQGFLLGVLAKTQFIQNAKTQFENAKTQFENLNSLSYCKF